MSEFDQNHVRHRKRDNERLERKVVELTYGTIRRVLVLEMPSDVMQFRVKHSSVNT